MACWPAGTESPGVTCPAPCGSSPRPTIRSRRNRRKELAAAEPQPQLAAPDPHAGTPTEELNGRASEALLDVLRREKDVALRDRAAESLQKITGKKLPPDAQAWEAELRGTPNGKPAADRKASFFGLFSWKDPAAPTPPPGQLVTPKGN